MGAQRFTYHLAEKALDETKIQKFLDSRIILHFVFQNEEAAKLQANAG